MNTHNEHSTTRGLLVEYFAVRLGLSNNWHRARQSFGRYEQPIDNRKRSQVQSIKLRQPVVSDIDKRHSRTDESNQSANTEHYGERKRPTCDHLLHVAALTQSLRKPMPRLCTTKKSAQKEQSRTNMLTKEHRSSNATQTANTAGLMDNKQLHCSVPGTTKQNDTPKNHNELWR